MITPALTERREGFEFVSGADGKIGEANHPRNEPAPTRDVASVQRFVIQITGHSATQILANRPIEVEHDVRANRARRIRDCAGGGVTVTGAEVPVTTERQRNWRKAWSEATRLIHNDRNRC